MKTVVISLLILVLISQFGWSVAKKSILIPMSHSKMIKLSKLPSSTPISVKLMQKESSSGLRFPRAKNILGAGIGLLSGGLLVTTGGIVSGFMPFFAAIYTYFALIGVGAAIMLVGIPLLVTGIAMALANKRIKPGGVMAAGIICATSGSILLALGFIFSMPFSLLIGSIIGGSLLLIGLPLFIIGLVGVRKRRKQKVSLQDRRPVSAINIGPKLEMHLFSIEI